MTVKLRHWVFCKPDAKTELGVQRLLLRNKTCERKGKEMGMGWSTITLDTVLTEPLPAQFWALDQ